MRFLVLLLVIATFLGAGAPAVGQNFGAGDVARSDARRPLATSVVTVVAILYADVRTPADRVDVTVGGALGAAGGLLVSRNASGLVQAAAAIAGGALGAKAAERLGDRVSSAVDIVVRRADGSLLTVTQQDADGLIEGAAALLMHERTEWQWERPASARVRALPPTASKGEN